MPEETTVDQENTSGEITLASGATEQPFEFRGTIGQLRALAESVIPGAADAAVSVDGVAADDDVEVGEKETVEFHKPTGRKA